MKNIIVSTLVACGLLFSAYADEQAYSLVNDENGYSYIQINQDLDSFSFKSDFKSIGNSGKVGYFVYPDGLSGDELTKYISDFAKNGDAEFAKKVNDGTIDIGKQGNGSKIGFYLHRNNGDVIDTWNFTTHNGITYIAFDKNGGHGKDEWMSVEDIRAVYATSPDTPMGQPLPGFIPVLMIGMVFFGIIYYRGKMNKMNAI